MIGCRISSLELFVEELSFAVLDVSEALKISFLNRA